MGLFPLEAVSGWGLRADQVVHESLWDPTIQVQQFLSPVNTRWHWVGKEAHLPISGEAPWRLVRSHWWEGAGTIHQPTTAIHTDTRIGCFSSHGTRIGSHMRWLSHAATSNILVCGHIRGPLWGSKNNQCALGININKISFVVTDRWSQTTSGFEIENITLLEGSYHTLLPCEHASGLPFKSGQSELTTPPLILQRPPWQCSHCLLLPRLWWLFLM